MPRILAALWSLPLPVRSVAPVAIGGLLWWSSSIPRDAQGAGQWRALLHNAAHVFAFAGLAAACWLLQAKPLIHRRGSVAALAVAVAFGLLDELHQRHVVGRSCSVVDLVSDGVGAAIAVAVLDWQFAPERTAGSVLLVLALVAIGSVILATWGPW